MEMFSLTLTQMLMMFCFILIGFFLRKREIVSHDSYKMLSKLEMWVFVPALNLYNQLTKCNVKTFAENSTLILYGTVMIGAALFLAYPLSRLFVRKSKESSDLSYRRNIYKYALTFGNYGFMGNFIILGIGGSDLYFKYSMFTMIIAIVCNSWGLYVLIPKEKGAGIGKNLMKGILTPPMIALLTGMIMGLTGSAKFVPEFMMNTFSNAMNCMGPVAMVLAGIVIGGYNIKELIANKKVYIVTFLRLVIIPAVFVSALILLGRMGVLSVNDEILTFALITFGTPLGLNTIVYPAAYGGETQTGASMAMISHTLCVITIPLMYLLFVVLL